MQSRRWRSGVPTVRALPRLARHRYVFAHTGAGCLVAVIDPRSLQDDQVLRTLAQCDRATPRGRLRGHPLTCAARPAGWRGGSSTTGGHRLARGELLVRNGQPESIASRFHTKWAKRWRNTSERGPIPCSSRQVFLRAQAPMEGFSSGPLLQRSSAARLSAAGRCAEQGACARHTLATRLLREGSSLPEIGEARHRQQPTTTTTKGTLLFPLPPRPQTAGPWRAPSEQAAEDAD